MSLNELVVYRPSGKFSSSLILTAPLILTALTIIQYLFLELQFNFSSIIFSFALFTIYVYLLGVICNQWIGFCKVRNPPLAVLAVLIMCVFSLLLYLLLVIAKMQLVAGIEVQFYDLIVQPSVFVSELALIINSYTIRVFEWEIQGPLLWSIWAFQIAVMISLVSYKVYRKNLNALFCESCKLWADKQPGIIGFQYPQYEELVERFLIGDASFLDNATAIFNVPMSNYYTIDGELCVGCNDLFAVSLNLVQKESDIEQGKIKKIVGSRLVTRAYFQRFQLLASQFPTPENI